ncbi:MAG: hypothetical protein IT201_14605 [Thermoleophilia bacterium]|nr:hypothetical protein [Thermoleophilia bacterium]
MTTRAQIRTTIRSELNDSGGVQLWSDALLNTWLIEALRDYGREVGLEKTTTLTTVASQASYALPADTLQVLRVEYPSGYFRVPSPYHGGDVAAEASPTPMPGLRPGELVYEVWGGSVILSPAPSASAETITVRYIGAYSEPANDGDSLDVPTREEAAIVAYVAMRAVQWIDTDESKRQRFERQKGASAREAARQYQEQYQSVIRQRRGSRISVRRLVPRGES